MNKPLTDKQKKILNIIYEQGSKSVPEFKKITGMNMNSIAVILLALEKKGYISIPVRFGRRFYKNLRIKDIYAEDEKR